MNIFVFTSHSKIIHKRKKYYEVYSIFIKLIHYPLNK